MKILCTLAILKNIEKFQKEKPSVAITLGHDYCQYFGSIYFYDYTFSEKLYLFTYIFIYKFINIFDEYVTFHLILLN